jgi:hypothetical protein
MSETTTQLSEEGFEVLRTAVNIARDHQCQSVSVLKERLLLAYPGREPLISEALAFWGHSLRTRLSVDAFSH